VNCRAYWVETLEVSHAPFVIALVTSGWSSSPASDESQAAVIIGQRSKHSIVASFHFVYAQIHQSPLAWFAASGRHPIAELDVFPLVLRLGSADRHR
jgi:hypothetical protein